MAQIIILMGVSGAGKSTIGQLLAKELGWPFYEGDDFHPPSNIQKMADGVPLTDDDRAAWLTALAQLISRLNRERQPAVLACSALKQAYREKLRGKYASVRIVFLQGNYDLISSRLRSRHGHFMKPGLLKSQFEILEEPDLAVTIDISRTPEQIMMDIRKAIGV